MLAVSALERVPVFASLNFSCRVGIDDDARRRDVLHAIINSLPDANYATLRALTLVSTPMPYIASVLGMLTWWQREQHLNRVQEHSITNRMNAGNLAICFGYVRHYPGYLLTDSGGYKSSDDASQADTHGSKHGPRYCRCGLAGPSH